MINQQISTDFSTHSTLPSPWLSGVSDPRPRCDHSTVAERTERLSCPSFVGSHELLKSSLVKGYAAESPKQTTSCENRLSFFVSIELLDRHESSNDYDSLGEGFKCRWGLSTFQSCLYPKSCGYFSTMMINSYGHMEVPFLAGRWSNKYLFDIYGILWIYPIWF